MKDIAIYGAGGLGREVACLLRRINEETGPEWNLVGFFDDGLPEGSANEYGKVIGNMETLNSYEKPLALVFAVGSPKVVEAIYGRITNPGIEFPNIIAPDTIFLDKDNVRMGKGNLFCSRCLVSCNVGIGDFNTFNGYITIGHDTEIGDFNTVMPAVKISGGVKIGTRNLLGVNSVILQYKKIGNNTVVGIGAIVLQDTKDGGTYVGNPARRVY